MAPRKFSLLKKVLVVMQVQRAFPYEAFGYQIFGKYIRAEEHERIYSEII